MLHEVGLTATELQPGDYTLLLENGIALTDLVEYSAGMDAALAGKRCIRTAADVVGYKREIAFHGKNTASFTGSNAIADLCAPVRATEDRDTAAGHAAMIAFWYIEP